MERYIFKHRKDGVYLINLGETWGKIQLASRVIASIENPHDIIVQSASAHGESAVSKFSHYTGAKNLSKRHTPGTFTNQTRKRFEEPRLLIVADPRLDYQSIKETTFVNIPVIALCDTDSSLKNVDIAIPGNTRNKQSLGVLFFILCKTVLQMKGYFRAKEISTFQYGTFVSSRSDVNNRQKSNETLEEPNSTSNYNDITEGDEATGLIGGFSGFTSNST
jgi:small subunit ribosomal protein SAe